MVVLPSGFVQLDHLPGYYWHVEQKKLYSVKVSGVLTPLKLRKAFSGFVRGTRVETPAGYAVSKQGRRRFVSLEYLEKLQVPAQTQEFPATL